MGTEKAATMELRNHIQGSTKIVPGTALDWPGGTPNHYKLMRAVAYAGDPDKGRAAVVAMLEDDLTRVGFMTHAGADECFTGSHPVWHYNAVCALLLIARRLGDHVVIALCTRWLRAEQRTNMLHRTPAKDVVIPGARSFAGGADADQTEQRGRLCAYLNGEKVRTVGQVQQSLDWTFLWALLLYEQEFRGELQPAMAGLSDADLPATRNPYTLVRGKGGHVGWFMTPPPLAMLRPAFWAAADYQSGKASYGCKAGWGKGETPGVLPADLPVPGVPGGAAGGPLTWPRPKGGSGSVSGSGGGGKGAAGGTGTNQMPKLQEGED